MSPALAEIVVSGDVARDQVERDLVVGGRLAQLQELRRADAAPLRGERIRARRLGVDARRDQDGIVPVADFLQRRIAADLEVAMKFHAALFQQIDTALDDILFQLETGNPIDQQTPNPIITIINSDLIPLAAQYISRRQPGRACPNDACRQPVFLSHLNRLHPAFFKGGFSDMFFNRTNRDRFKAFFDHTIAFTQTVLRADPPTNFRKCVGRR